MSKEINRFDQIKNDILSGLTVALALVPEAVAFAFVAGISPIIGLYGAFMMGLITSVFGGRPGMISGATGAMAVVMVSLVKEGEALGGPGAGVQVLFLTLLLTGLFQIIAGVMKLGKFVRMIPSPVMMGFVNGLAIVIFLSQLGMFKSHGEWLTGVDLWTMLGLCAMTMGIMVKQTVKTANSIRLMALNTLLQVFTISRALSISFSRTSSILATDSLTFEPASSTSVSRVDFST